jgi:hypothetical protein
VEVSGSGSFSRKKSEVEVEVFAEIPSGINWKLEVFEKWKFWEHWPLPIFFQKFRAQA